MFKCDLPLDGIKLPNRCVVCGEEATSLLSYDQDNAPMIVGVLAVVSWRKVSFPYCQYHEERFRRRLRILGIFQAICFVPGLLLMCYVGLHWNSDISRLFYLDMSEDTQVVLIVVSLVLMVLPAFTLFIKHFLYDARISISGKKCQICAKSSAFIEELARLN